MDSVFFILSKLYWLVGGPDSLLLFLLTLGVLVAWWASPRKKAFTLLGVVLAAFWIVAIYPVGNLLLYPLDSRFPRPQLPPSEEIAGVIVLGGAEHMAPSNHWQSLEVNEASERLLAMSQLLHHYPQLAFIYTCGSGSVLNQDVKGADLVKTYFDSLGITDRIIYERESRNTYENALFSKPLMPASDKPWLLVTSAFHMPRSVGIFRQQGIKVLPYPVDHWSMPPKIDGFYFDFSENLRALKMGVREWTGLTAYWLTGKTVSWFPSPADLSSDE